LTLLLAGGAAAGPAWAGPAGGTAVYEHDGTGERLLLDAPARGAAFFNLRDFARGCVLWNCTTWDNTVSSFSVRSFGSITLFAGADATGDCYTYVNNTDAPRSFNTSQLSVAFTSASPASATGTWNDLASSVIVTTAAATPAAATRCPVIANGTLATGFDQEPTDRLLWPWQSEGAAAKGINIRGGVAQTGWNNAWIRTSGTGWNAISRQDLQLRPKMGYVIRAWVQTSPNLRNGHMGLRPAGSVVPYRGVAFGASPPGQYRLIELRLPARQVGYTFFLGYWGQHGEDSWVRIDNISVQQDDLASLT
jgi:hypothetical protein